MNSIIVSSPTGWRNSAIRRRGGSAGELTEDEFRPLRLMNGLYLQLHAYMLRIAIPYGTLSSRQMRRLADIAERWDRGYGHFTTRQNMQFNWIKLEDTADILAALAEVEMHAIQTSGNCIRNVTTDHWAGAAADELADPRPVAELLRQWSSLHPEFSYLPRKFKIAVTGAPQDRAAVKVHDIGLRMHLERRRASAAGKSSSAAARDAHPSSASRCATSCPKRSFCPISKRSCASTTSMAGATTSTRRGSRSWFMNSEPRNSSARSRPNTPRRATADVEVDARELERIARYFAPPAFENLEQMVARVRAGARHRPRVRPMGQGECRGPCGRPAMRSSTSRSSPRAEFPAMPPPTRCARSPIWRSASHSMSSGSAITRTSCCRTSSASDLYTIWKILKAHELASANLGLVGDIIACPGLDYCTLATARSIPIAQSISRRFGDLSRQQEIGPLKINISGCINACGHHHVGHIGILGLDKKGEEFYQITLGGSSSENASIGQILGPGFAGEQVPEAIEKIIDTYLEAAQRHGGDVPRCLSQARRPAFQGGALCRCLRRRASWPMNG